VLRGDATEADKAMACKELAVFGSVDAVPDLAKLLDNERLASWARIPLEAIPDAACDAALREAAEKLGLKVDSSGRAQTTLENLFLEAIEPGASPDAGSGKN
jgi:hypothetical protein